MSHLFEGPLSGVPVELHDVVQPFLDTAERIGRKTAEGVSTYLPLPWSEEQGAEILAVAVNNMTAELVREAPLMPDFVVLAMQRSMLKAMTDRLDVLFEASGGQSQGGRA